MDRIGKITLGAATGTLSMLLVGTGFHTAAAMTPSLAFLVLASIAKKRGVRVSTADLLTGALFGVLLSHPVVGEYGISPLFWITAGFFLLSYGLISWRHEPPPPENGLSPHLAFMVAALAFQPGMNAPLRDSLAVSGQDLGALVFALLPLLIAAALGAAVAGFLKRRHPEIGTWLAPVISLLALLALLFEPISFDTILEKAGAIHGPSVTRTTYLFGVTLLAASLGGYVAFFLGGLIAAVSPVSSGSFRLFAVPALLWIALFLVPLPDDRTLTVSLVLLTGILSAIGFRRKILLAATALCLIFFCPLLTSTGPRDYVLDDPIRTATGSGDSNPGPTAKGRPLSPPAPPGWPLATDPILEFTRLTLASDLSGPVQLVGAYASWIRSQVMGVVVDATARGPGTVIWLPSVLAGPLDWLSPALGGVARMDQDTNLIIMADLTEISFQNLCLAARIVTDRGGAPATFSSGNLVAFVERPEELDAPMAATHGWPELLSPRATLELASRAEGDPVDRLLDREDQLRLPSRRPSLAAHNLQRLLRLSDTTDSLTVGDPEWETRIRLEMARAILNDDARETDRLLQALSRFNAPNAEILSAARARAQKQLLLFLLEERDRDPSNADIRHRLGTLFLHQGNVAAAIAELTRAVELRQRLEGAVVDLMDAFLSADETGYRKWTAVGPLPNLPQIPGIAETMLPEPTDPLVTGRYLRVLAECHHRRALVGERTTREEELGLAADLYRQALAEDPLDATSHRELARTLLAQGTDGVLLHAREAVRLDPLSPEAHALLAQVTPDAAERERSARAFFWIAALDPHACPLSVSR